MKIDATNKYFKELNEEINEAIEKDDTIILSGICGQRYIGAGLPKGKKIEIYGIPGNDLGCYMDGTDIEVFASGQDAVGNTMNDGSIVIHGSAGDALGYAMRGGKIFIEKNVGYRCGIHMKEFKEAKPVIVIGGYAGAFLGEYMAGGIVVLLGRNLPEDKFAAAGYCATGMHGGVMYLPVNREVDLHLRAIDVIHSFFVPSFRFKQDAVPGLIVRMHFTPTEIGDYEIACAELCGLGHYKMHGMVKVVSQEDFDKWIASREAEKQ
jgi:glutamate synthase domain-containing protein 3